MIIFLSDYVMFRKRELPINKDKLLKIGYLLQGMLDIQCGFCRREAGVCVEYSLQAHSTG